MRAEGAPGKFWDLGSGQVMTFVAWEALKPLKLAPPLLSSKKGKRGASFNGIPLIVTPRRSDRSQNPISDGFESF